MSDHDGALWPRQDDAHVLCGRLKEVSRRIRGLRAFSRGVRFALLAHLVLVPWLLLRGILPLPPGVYLLALLAVAMSGAACGLLAPLPFSLVARLLDHRLALKERIGSALEVMDRQGHPMVDALLHDAASSVRSARFAVAFPIAPPAEARFLLPALVFAAALLLLPPLPLLPSASTNPRGGADAERAHESLVAAAEAVRPYSRDEELPRQSRGREGIGANRLQPAARQAWSDLTATFRDTALALKRPDFTSFLKGGDERLKLLAPSTAFPDLRGDFTQSPNQAQIRKVQEALRDARLGGLSPRELERLTAELRNLNRGPDRRGQSEREGPPDTFTGNAVTPSDKRLEALERALDRLRERNAARGGEGGRSLKPAPEPGREAGDQGEEERDRVDGPRIEAQEKGSRPGRTPSPQIRDRPTPRTGGRKPDSTLSGQAREGDRESYDTDLAGPGAKSPSRLPYLNLLTRYRQMAEEALSKERVPFDYREQVKEYFKSLER